MGSLGHRAEPEKETVQRPRRETIQRPRRSREGAAEEEPDHAPAPEVPDVRWFLEHLAVPPNAVFGHVGPQVGRGRDGAWARVTRLSDLQKRTCTRIAERKREEREGVLLRQAEQIGLHKSG